jgi:hypothetical protein
MSVDNHSLILVDLKNVGHQDDTCVLADRVSSFHVLDPETKKHIVIFRK